MASVFLLSAKLPPSSTVLQAPTPAIFSVKNPRKYYLHLHGRRFTSSIASSSSFRNGRKSPETDCPVPLDQQPVNEYQSLSQSFPFAWASSDLFEYCSHLIATGASFGLFVGLPVAWFEVANPESEPLNCALGAVSTELFVVTLAVIRMYLGWSYVGNRLLSATVEYEETGWYDGQIWVKTAEVLARDCLLGSFSVIGGILNFMRSSSYQY